MVAPSAVLRWKNTEQSVVAALDSDRPKITAGLVMASASSRALAESVLAHVASKRALSDDVELEGAIGALASFGGGRLKMAEALADLWIGRHGAAFALRAAVAQRKHVVTHLKDPRSPGGFDFSVRWLAERRPEQFVPVLDFETYATLHDAAIKKAARSSCEETAQALRADAPFPLACFIDGIVPVSVHAIDSMTKFLALPPGEERTLLRPFAFALLEGLATSPDDAAARDAAFALFQATIDDPASANRAVEHVDAIRALADNATEYFVALLRLAHKNSIVEMRSAKKLAEAIASEPSDEATHFFATHLESKLVGTIAVEYMRANAARAAVALSKPHEPLHEEPNEDAELAEVRKKARKKHVRAADRVLAELAQVKGDELRAGLADLVDDQAAKKAVETQLKKNVGAREARDEELPSILREPPWRKSRSRAPRKKRRTVSDLEPLAFEDKLHLSESDTEGVDEDDNTPIGRLVRTGLAAVDEIARNHTKAPEFYSLRRIESPRAARAIAIELAVPARKNIAEDWLTKFPEAAIIGLLPSAIGSPADPVATEALRILVSRHADLIRDVAARYKSDDVTNATDDWLNAHSSASDHDTPKTPPRPPAWLNAQMLPRIALASGALLSPAAASLIVEMLHFSDPKKPYAGLDEVKTACDARSLDAWLVALVEMWANANGPAGARWVLDGMAHICDADAAAKMAQLLKTWARSYDTRSTALLAVEALSWGNEFALTALADVARKGGVRGIVAEMVDSALREAARRQHLNEDDLADRLVPTLDLDANGTTTLDYGSRKFEVRLDAHLEPNPKTAPRAVKADDPVKARTEIARFKALKKALASIGKSTTFRFELAMTTGRKWRARDFQTAVIGHPLLSLIARRLVWSSADESGTFRVAEDGTFANEKDEQITLPDDASVSVIHPLTMTPEQTRVWGERFGEYEILQPFPQLGRATFSPGPEEMSSPRMVRRFQGIEALFMAICGRLEARGWRRFDPEDGVVAGYGKSFGDIGARYLFSDPIQFGEAMPSMTTLGTIHFTQPIPSAIAFSEAAYDLHVFASE